MEIKPNVVLRTADNRCFVGTARAEEDRSVNFVTGFEARWTVDDGWMINLSEDEDESDWCLVHAVAETTIHHDLNELTLGSFLSTLR